MNNNNVRKVSFPMILVAAGIFIASACFLKPAIELTGRASLLPVAMLIAMMVLSVVLVVITLRSKTQSPTKPLVESFSRVLAGLFSIFIFVVSVDYIGFYLTTAVFIPCAAYFFGCRSLKTLLIADLIVVLGIYIIFGLAMSKGFPIGRIW